MLTLSIRDENTGQLVAIAKPGVMAWLPLEFSAELDGWQPGYNFYGLHAHVDDA